MEKCREDDDPYSPVPDLNTPYVPPNGYAESYYAPFGFVLGYAPSPDFPRYDDRDGTWPFCPAPRQLLTPCDPQFGFRHLQDAWPALREYGIHARRAIDRQYLRMNFGRSRSSSLCLSATISGDGT
jgi:hypothetical protein